MAFRNFERRIRSGKDHAAFESHLAKYRKLVPALALLIHLADAMGGRLAKQHCSRRWHGPSTWKATQGELMQV